MIAWPLVAMMVVGALIGGICATLAVVADQGMEPWPSLAKWCDRIGRLAIICVCIWAALAVAHI